MRVQSTRTPEHGRLALGGVHLRNFVSPKCKVKLFIQPIGLRLPEELVVRIHSLPKFGDGKGFGQKSPTMQARLQHSNFGGIFGGINANNYGIFSIK